MTAMRRPSLPSVTTTVAPKWRSMFSVWSRVGSGSITLVSPGALKPASRMADFTCADGTGSRYSIGSGSLVPITASGRRDPSRATKRAPIWVSGSVTRAIGRRHSDSSPVKKLVKGCVATRPINKSRAGAGIAEIEHRFRLREPADADTMHGPGRRQRRARSARRGGATRALC